MATVYIAHDVKHGRQVAVKVLLPELTATLGADRFLKEIRIAAGLNHPHILTLIDSGGTGEYLYYVMPFVDGESLRGRLNRERVLELPTAMSILKDVADALGYAHRQGIIHRDIKPENVLLAEGHAVVADFGIAKAVSTAAGGQLTVSGFPLGTVGYMSPEQAAGSTDLNEATDVFSLACVGYEMLIGDVPGRWPSDNAVAQGRFLDAPLEHRAKLDMLPSSTEATLVKAMALRPEDRFVSPGQLIDALTASGGDPVKYRTADVQRIVQRAAELDRDEPTETGAMSMGSVERLAAEVGIAPEYVRDAARVLQQSEREPKPSLFYGAPEFCSIERTVAGEISERDYPLLLEILRRTVGFTGRAETLGGSLEWSSMETTSHWRSDPTIGLGQIREVHVAVTPRDGNTRIVIEERLRRATSSVMAMATAIAVVPSTVGGIWLSEAVGAGVALASVAVLMIGSFGFARMFNKKLVKSRKQELHELADELTSEVGRRTSSG
jgi:serine/threonine protein kinase